MEGVADKPLESILTSQWFSLIRIHARSYSNMLCSFGLPMLSPSFTPAELDVHVATVLAGPEVSIYLSHMERDEGNTHIWPSALQRSNANISLM